MLYVLRRTDLRTLIAFPYFESRLKPRTLQSNYNQAVCSNMCDVFLNIILKDVPSVEISVPFQ